MTIKQYSELQRLIGNLEGFNSAPIAENPRGTYLTYRIERLKKLIDDLWKEDGRLEQG